MASHLQRLIDLCRETHQALTTDSCSSPTPIAFSPEVEVQFPTRDDTLARIQPIATAAPWRQHAAAITYHYLETCHRLQEAVKHEYIAFCHEAESLEHFGAPTDIELQHAVALGLSRWYMGHERKVADVILSRLPSHVGTAGKALPSTVGEEAGAKHILRRAFLANSSPSDAERDYLARQTGMTYRQVTVWFQNNRSRKISSLPKRGRQQSSQQTSPPKSASTMTSLHEVEQNLRNPTDSPLAQDVLLPPPPPTSSSNTPPITPKLESQEDNEKAIVSRSHLMITEPRAFDADARGGNGDVEGVKGRKIKPLRKTRLAGKKPAQPISENPTTLEKCTTAPTRHIKVYSPGLEDVQLNPTEILKRAEEQGRVTSSSSVEMVDSALDVDSSRPGSRVVFSGSSDEVLALPIDLSGRSVSTSSTTQVDASLDTQAFKNGTNGMIPMFNFLPPTPSHTVFSPTSRPATSHSASGKQDPSPLQFDPIDFSSLLGLGTGDVAQNLLKDLEELDFEQFLCSPATSSDASGSPDPEYVHESYQDGTSLKQARETEGGEGRMEYLFEDMPGMEGDVDPAIWEMLRGILNGSEAPTGTPTVEGKEARVGNVGPMTPAPTPVDGVSEVENDPFAALSIDLSALLDITPQGHSAVAPFGSSVIIPQDGEVSAIPINSSQPTSTSGNAQVGDLQKGKEPDWQGLLDFTEMFDAFWGMVDAQAAAAPVAVAE